MRVRVAEKTMKQPITVSADWASSSTQSMLRLGSPGLDRMLPKPGVGLALEHLQSAMALVDRAGALAGCVLWPCSRCRRAGRSWAGSVLSRSSGSETFTGSSGVMPDRAGTCT